MLNLGYFAVFCEQENHLMGKNCGLRKTAINFLVSSIVGVYSLKGAEAHAYLQFSRREIGT